MYRTRVKFCGITRTEDAQQAIALGADAIGMVLYPKASTAVDIEASMQIAKTIPPFVNIVLLFVNAETDFVRTACEKISPTLLQFHGDEDAAYCRTFNYPYIRACRVASAEDINKAVNDFADAHAILLDAYKKGVYGGSGDSFCWDLIPKTPSAKTPPFIIAGGLSPDNVGDLICQHRPFAVDVSSGIACPEVRRHKNYDKMLSFMNAVRHADSTFQP